jgi:riboflavin kinase/FMN adenylyltransferase
MQELLSFVDCLAVLRFTQRLANTSAEDFIVQTLVNRLRAIEIWVGPDFHFGHARKGNIDLLKALGKQYHFAAHTIEPVQTDEERVSSSRIRIALAQDDFAAAARLLGRPYSIEGHVVRGQQLGRKLGFPTANLRISWGLAPITGIFAVHVSSRNLTHWPAVASLGTRPTVQGKEPILEAHLFDFDDDLYGQIISITFIAKLREEKYFNSLDELSQQMRHDAALARDILARALKKIDLGNTQS